MATLRKRGNRWHAQVRRKGHQPITRSFINKADAERWVRQEETRIDQGSIQHDPRILRAVTVGDLIERYRDSVTVQKKGRKNETIILNALLRRSFADKTLAEISPADFTAYRDERVKRVKATTIRREMSLLRHAFVMAQGEWGFPITNNPLDGLRRPRMDAPRERRLRSGELLKLLRGCRESRVAYLRPLIVFAIETGMRRGEIVAIRRDHVDLDAKLLHVPVTKTGYPRTIPLTERAVRILRDHLTDKPKVFPCTTSGLQQAWKRLVNRVGIEDLRFHDLRHEAVSRFFEMGLSIPEVALISGHRDPRMLFRYTHLRPQDVGDRLRMIWERDRPASQVGC